MILILSYLILFLLTKALGNCIDFIYLNIANKSNPVEFFYEVVCWQQIVNKIEISL